MKKNDQFETNNLLSNIKNYKQDLINDPYEVITKISELFAEYFKFITEKNKLKNSKLLIFIIMRGLDTINNVFNFILFYTKNLDITYFHCQKAFYFYAEFIEQIFDDEKLFLQLTSRDAVIYVYKKTIFDVNKTIISNHKKISANTHLKLETIKLYLNLYKIILIKLINNYNDINQLNSVETIYYSLNNLGNKLNIKLTTKVIEHLCYKIEDINYFLKTCVLLVEKLTEDPTIVNNFIKNILSDDFNDKLNKTPDQFIEWLMTDL